MTHTRSDNSRATGQNGGGAASALSSEKPSTGSASCSPRPRAWPGRRRRRCYSSGSALLAKYGVDEALARSGPDQAAAEVVVHEHVVLESTNPTRSVSSRRWRWLCTAGRCHRGGRTGVGSCIV